MQERTTRLVQQTVFESLIKAFDIQNNPELIKEIKQTLGYDHLYARREYPYRLFQQLVLFLCQKFYPEQPLSQSIAEIARKQAHFFVTGTIFGKVTYATRGMINHHKFLQNFASSQNLVFNFGHRSSHEIGPKQNRYLALEDVADPEYMKSVLRTLLELNKAKNVRIEYKVLKKHDTEYLISWDE